MKRVVRLLVVLLPLAVLAGTVPASANDEAGYLALGDSVAFGYNPLVFNSNPTDTDAYIGYPEVLSKHVVNASCSGETSGSLIVGPPDNGCAGFRSVAPLHVGYTGTQLGFAVAYMRAHPDTQLVTIDIGANDLFVLLRTCAGSSSCFAAGFPVMLSSLASNLVTIWRFDNPSQRYQGVYFSNPAVPTDGPTASITSVFGIFACVAQNGSVG